MGADLFLVYYGLRWELNGSTEEEVALLEERLDPRQQVTGNRPHPGGDIAALCARPCPAVAPGRPLDSVEAAAGRVGQQSQRRRGSFGQSA